MIPVSLRFASTITRRWTRCRRIRSNIAARESVSWQVLTPGKSSGRVRSSASPTVSWRSLYTPDLTSVSTSTAS